MLLLGLQFCNLLAQEPPFWQYTDEDGLPSMTVYQILQDKKGFIWLGTANGICRFDGINFKRFDSSKLSDSEILKIQEDEEGKIWFINLSGQIGYVQNDLVSLFEPDDFLKEGKIIDFSLLSDNKIFFNYSGKHTSNTTLVIYQNEQKLDFISPLFAGIGQMNYVGNENILFSGIENARFHESSSVYLLDKDELDLQKLNFKSDFKDRTFFHSFPFSSDTLLFYHDLNIYQSTASSLKLLHKDRVKIRNVYRIDEQIWTATENGIMVYDNFFSKNKPQNHFLKDYRINGILKDVENNIWVITDGDGLLFIPNIQTQVYTTQTSEIFDNQTFCIQYNSLTKKLWAGLSEGNIFEIDTEQNTSKNIGTKINGRVLFLESKDDMIFAGGDGGITKFLPNSKTDILWIHSSPFKCMFVDNKDVFWLGSQNCPLTIPSYLSNYNEITPTDLRIRDHFFYDSLGFIHKPYAFFQNHDSIVWIGSIRGIYFLDPANGSPKPFLENGEHKSYRISAINMSSDSIMWISTHGHGLLKLNNNKIIGRVTEEEGLATNLILSLFIDKEGNIWIGTNQGLNILNSKTGNISLFDKTKGLPSNEINAIYADEKEAWIGTSKGLVHFPTKALLPNEFTPPIHVTNFKIWEKDTTLETFYSLNSKQNNLHIEFVGLAYRMRGMVNYQYRLLGLDTSWTTTNSSFARYPVLNPGEYEFQVVAVNEDGYKSEEPAIIHFEILPPFWQTWWFRIGVILSTISVIWFILSARFKRIQERENERQEFQRKVNDLRMQALQTQMNPHFIFNALNAIQQFLTTNDQEKAMIYLARFARLIRSIFEQSKKREISLEEELDLLRLYLDLEKLRFKDKISINLIIDKSLEKTLEDWKLPPLLIQPIIENSFKHGLMHKKSGGILNINFEQKEDFLKCTVEDNGVGRARSKELNSWRPKSHQSSGLKSTKERLEILSKNKNRNNGTFENFQIIDLYDAKENPAGTRVEMFI